MRLITESAECCDRTAVLEQEAAAHFCARRLSHIRRKNGVFVVCFSALGTEKMSNTNTLGYSVYLFPWQTNKILVIPQTPLGRSLAAFMIPYSGELVY
jgi:hypothetical protein